MKDDVGRKLHGEFWKETTENQGNFLFGLIHLAEIKQRRPRGDVEISKRRQVTVKYTLPTAEGHIQVCSQTFKNILGVSARRVATLITKKKLGQLIFKNLRGSNPRSHAHKSKYTEEDVNLVKAHISSFPTEESHYTRHKTTKLYLSPDLNINRMYKVFKKDHPEANIDQRFYRRVFRKHFKKLSFRRPRTDTCVVCDLLASKGKIAVGTEKLSFIKKKELHLRKAENAMKAMHLDNKKSRMPSSSACTITMDMQQVIFTPTLTHSSMFYSRQLSNYNLCVHVGDTGQSYMCLWHEGIAGRGGNEVSSCLLKVITSLGFTHKKSLQIWCDNCAGQNKNRMVLMTLIWVVAMNYFEKVDLKFLVSGHSYMPCDRDFGIIEKRKKVCKTMVPGEVADMIRDAKSTQPFQVVNMGPADFKDIARCSDTFLNTAGLKISTVSWIQISRAEFPTIKTRGTLNELEQWKEVKILKKGQSIQNIVEMGPFPELQSRQTIADAKKKDLLAMLDFMDSKYRSFYENICS